MSFDFNTPWRLSKSNKHIFLVEHTLSLIVVSVFMLLLFFSATICMGLLPSLLFVAFSWGVMNGIQVFISCFDICRSLLVYETGFCVLKLKKRELSIVIERNRWACLNIVDYKDRFGVNCSRKSYGFKLLLLLFLKQSSSRLIKSIKVKKDKHVVHCSFYW